MKKNTVVMIQAFLFCCLLATVWGSLSGCGSHEFVDLGDDAGTDSGSDDGNTEETACTPDDSPAVLEGDDPSCGPVDPCEGSAEAYSVCRQICESVCTVLVEADLFWIMGDCRDQCEASVGCDRTGSGPWDYVSQVCPNANRLITVREAHQCQRDLESMEAWCAFPESCFVTDDWLPESCTWTGLCDGARDSC